MPWPRPPNANTRNRTGCGIRPTSRKVPEPWANAVRRISRLDRRLNGSLRLRHYEGSLQIGGSGEPVAPRLSHPVRGLGRHGVVARLGSCAVAAGPFAVGGATASPGGAVVVVDGHPPASHPCPLLAARPAAASRD